MSKLGFKKRIIFITKSYPSSLGRIAVDVVQEVTIGNNIEYSAAIFTDAKGTRPILVQRFENKADAIQFVKDQPQYPGESDELL